MDMGPSIRKVWRPFRILETGIFGSSLVRESEAGPAGCRFVCKVLLWGHGAGLAVGQNKLYGVCKHKCVYPTFRHISV